MSAEKNLVNNNISMKSSTEMKNLGQEGASSENEPHQPNIRAKPQTEATIPVSKGNDLQNMRQYITRSKYELITKPPDNSPDLELPNFSTHGTIKDFLRNLNLYPSRRVSTSKRVSKTVISEAETNQSMSPRRSPVTTLCAESGYLYTTEVSNNDSDLNSNAQVLNLLHAIDVNDIKVISDAEKTSDPSYDTIQTFSHRNNIPATVTSKSIMEDNSKPVVGSEEMETLKASEINMSNSSLATPTSPQGKLLITQKSKNPEMTRESGHPKKTYESTIRTIKFNHPAMPCESIQPKVTSESSHTKRTHESPILTNESNHPEQTCESSNANKIHESSHPKRTHESPIMTNESNHPEKNCESSHAKKTKKSSCAKITHESPKKTKESNHAKKTKESEHHKRTREPVYPKMTHDSPIIIESEHRKRTREPVFPKMTHDSPIIIESEHCKRIREPVYPKMTHESPIIIESEHRKRTREPVYPKMNHESPIIIESEHRKRTRKPVYPKMNHESPIIIESEHRKRTREPVYSKMTHESPIIIESEHRKRTHEPVYPKMNHESPIIIESEHRTRTRKPVYPKMNHESPIISELDNPELTLKSEYLEIKHESDHIKVTRKPYQIKMAPASSHAKVTPVSKHTKMTSVLGQTKMTSVLDLTKVTPASGQTMMNPTPSQTKMTSVLDYTNMISQLGKAMMTPVLDHTKMTSMSGQTMTPALGQTMATPASDHTVIPISGQARMTTTKDTMMPDAVKPNEDGLTPENYDHIHTKSPAILNLLRAKNTSLIDAKTISKSDHTPYPSSTNPSCDTIRTLSHRNDIPATVTSKSIQKDISKPVVGIEETAPPKPTASETNMSNAGMTPPVTPLGKLLITQKSKVKANAFPDIREVIRASKTPGSVLHSILAQLREMAKDDDLPELVPENSAATNETEKHDHQLVDHTLSPVRVEAVKSVPIHLYQIGNHCPDLKMPASPIKQSVVRSLDLKIKQPNLDSENPHLHSANQPIVDDNSEIVKMETDSYTTSDHQSLQEICNTMLSLRELLKPIKKNEPTSTTIEEASPYVDEPASSADVLDSSIEIDQIEETWEPVKKIEPASTSMVDNSPNVDEPESSADVLDSSIEIDEAEDSLNRNTTQKITNPKNDQENNSKSEEQIKLDAENDQSPLANSNPEEQIKIDAEHNQSLQENSSPEEQIKLDTENDTPPLAKSSPEEQIKLDAENYQYPEENKNPEEQIKLDSENDTSPEDNGSLEEQIKPDAEHDQPPQENSSPEEQIKLDAEDDTPPQECSNPEDQIKLDADNYQSPQANSDPEEQIKLDADDDTSPQESGNPEDQIKLDAENYQYPEESKNPEEQIKQDTVNDTSPQESGNPEEQIKLDTDDDTSPQKKLEEQIKLERTERFVENVWSTDLQVYPITTHEPSSVPSLPENIVHAEDQTTKTSPTTEYAPDKAEIRNRNIFSVFNLSPSPKKKLKDKKQHDLEDVFGDLPKDASNMDEDSDQDVWPEDRPQGSPEEIKAAFQTLISEVGTLGPNIFINSKKVFRPPVHNDEDSSESYTNIKSTSEPILCPICNKPFKYASHILEHVKIHFQLKPFKCHFCPKRFRRKHGGLKKHMLTHTAEKRLKCEICEKTFTQSAYLMQHMSSHTDYKPFKCDLCGRAFKKKCHVQAHMSCQHSDDKPYICSICGKRYKLNSHLVQHIKTHSDERAYSCAECSKSFHAALSLKRHMKLHTGEKPFECEVCGKTFIERGNWTRHLKRVCQREMEDRKFKCEFCDKRFLQRNHRKVHMRIHTDEIPYWCRLCGKGFRTAGNRKSHYTWHVKKGDIDSVEVLEETDALIEAQARALKNAKKGMNLPTHPRVCNIMSYSKDESDEDGDAEMKVKQDE